MLWDMTKKPCIRRTSRPYSLCWIRLQVRQLVTPARISWNYPVTWRQTAPGLRLIQRWIMQDWAPGLSRGISINSLPGEWSIRGWVGPSLQGIAHVWSSFSCFHSSGWQRIMLSCSSPYDIWCPHYLISGDFFRVSLIMIFNRPFFYVSIKQFVKSLRLCVLKYQWHSSHR